VGIEALKNNVTGVDNTATGFRALMNNTSVDNTANGFGALQNNTVGSANTATGSQALLSNTEGSSNTATGGLATPLAMLTPHTVRRRSLLIPPAQETRARGPQHLQATRPASVILLMVLQSNTSGNGNTATGVAALSSNTVGVENTAIGFNALAANIDGANNTAVGSGALVNSNSDFNTALGLDALSNNTTGGSNIALGRLAGTGVATANNVICIGALVDGADVSNSCYIGSIHGQTVDSGTGLSVFVDSAGKLGTTLSSRRFKRDIQPMDKSSEVVLALKPVTFYYKTDANGTPQFGLLAEDVADVDPELVVRDRDGELLSGRYDQVNAMLLNEFIKEHRKVEEQQATIAQLKQDFQFEFAEQEKEIEALTKGLERASAQLEADRSLPQVVAKSP
jgi:hypothetical protein